MTTVCWWIRTFSMTGAIVLAATIASPQSAHDGRQSPLRDGIRGEWGQTSSGQQSTLAMLKVGMTRMGTIDADLKALVADMNMFTGEIKVETMARLLTLLVERQSMMRAHMMEMHERMMGTMSGVIPSPSIDRPFDGTMEDPEPGAMCAPIP